MTAPSAEGALWVRLYAKPPLKGEVPAKRAEGFRLPCAAMVAAALSAAVTTTKPQGIAPTSHGRTSREKKSSLFPATLRERGSGGEVLLLEKQSLPRSSPRNFLYVFLRVFDLGGEETHEGEEGWERRGAVGVCKRGDQQPAAEHKD